MVCPGRARGCPTRARARPPRRPTTSLHPGDVVYVVTNGRGHAQLAELPDAQAALVALDPDDGAVSAMVGGFDYYNNKFNRATQARRQPGSGFKPFLYSCALDHGFTPSTVVLDAPIVYDDSDQEKIWRPENDEGGFEGPMRLREGLVFSRNLITIRIVRQLGVDLASACAAKFGFDPQDMPKDLTLALGSLPVTPLQMATAYAVFANGGYRVNSYFVDRIEDAAGQVVYQAAPKVVCNDCDALAASAPGTTGAPGAPGIPGAAASTTAPLPSAASAGVVPTSLTTAPGAAPVGPAARPGAAGDLDHEPPALVPPLLPADRIAPRVISPQNCWLMDDMMADVIKRGTGIRAGNALERNDIAGKTGTTNQARDTWFNGFTRNIVASVWVGYDDERPLGEGEEGSRTAVPIWIAFMREALRGQPDHPQAPAARTGHGAYLPTHGTAGRAGRHRLDV